MTHYSKSHEDSYDPSAFRLTAWLKSALNSYSNARWGLQSKPANGWARYLVSVAPPLRSFCIDLMRRLPAKPPRPDARLLDVGCGNGGFLTAARAAGWLVMGVDADPKAVALARSKGLEVRCGGLEQLTDLAGTFDYVTCHHVIEHVHDPRQWIKDMAALLRSDGSLWIQTPNIESIGHARYGADWLALDPPRHLVLFTPNTLMSMMKECGFDAHLSPLPMAAAVAVYADSRALQRRTPLWAGSLSSLLHWPTVRDAGLQALGVARSESITAVAVRRN